ncbi:Flp family type IVb pilin [Ornithinimicrobium cryptoxanthini]|uniref:Flp family type IVb pilin n=1 Tax=Ornithinimicrobium cryptoxanthini TaxID=2934161 RepID=UPI0021189B80|nr:Flp family type IVb pilin [Ornithinimicrobium cryptoxanthini]
MLALHYFFTVTLRERFEDKERGATAVEYGLLVALIAVAIITTVGLLGGQLNAMFVTVRQALP